MVMMDDLQRLTVHVDEEKDKLGGGAWRIQRRPRCHDLAARATRDYSDLRRPKLTAVPLQVFFPHKEDHRHQHI